MKPAEFTSLDDSKPEKFKHIIVTNNIDAKNAHDEMSHVWMTNFLQESKEGRFLTFDSADREITALTHWKYA